MKIAFVKHDCLYWDFNLAHATKQESEVYNRLLADNLITITDRIDISSIKTIDLPFIPQPNMIIKGIIPKNSCRIEDVVINYKNIIDKDDKYYVLNNVDSDIVCIYHYLHPVNFIKYIETFTHEFDKDNYKYQTILPYVEKIQFFQDVNILEREIFALSDKKIMELKDRRSVRK